MADLLAKLPAGFASLTVNTGLAFHRLRGDPWSAAFVVLVYANLLLLFWCLRAWEETDPHRNRPKRQKLKLAALILGGAFGFSLTYLASELLPPALKVLVWCIAGCVAGAGLFASCFLPAAQPLRQFGGWIEWDGELFEFEDAPSYSEKNWGAGFPRKWFWVQCNVFDGASGEVALTVGGGLRKLPGLSDIYENVALIGVHFGGSFYEFVPWTGTVSWQISTWGYWHFSAENNSFMVELEATTKDSGIPLRAPTTEAGLVTACRDTCFADLWLKLWERRYDGSKGKLILDVTSNMAAVEIGGGPWYASWKATSSSPEVISQALRLPVDVEGFFPIPFLKPAGL